MTNQQLAQDMAALWNATTTTNGQRQEILRQLLHRIVVHTQGPSEQVKLWIEWTGGTQTEHPIVRPVASFEQLSDYPQLCQRIQS
jgi:hypothetical protein